MATDQKTDDQTEKATPKKLRDARKRGELAKSRDLTLTLSLMTWLLIALVMWRFVLDEVSRTFAAAFQYVSHPSTVALRIVGTQAAQAWVSTSLSLLAPAAVLATAGEFAQVGPVLPLERLTLRPDRMNPAAGLKRLLSGDNLFETGKSLIKAVLLTCLVIVVVKKEFSELPSLTQGDPSAALSALCSSILRLLATALVPLGLMAAADIAYQRFSFGKKMRMSRREVRQEKKETQGNPMLKRQRRQLHREWADRNAVQAARTATAVVMNPTHIAVTLAYDPAEHPAPVVTGKGMDALALEMRAAAEHAGVPIITNVALARELNAQALLDEIVPVELFAAVAEVIIFARRLHAGAGAREPFERTAGPHA